jgi:hypothetical protein
MFLACGESRRFNSNGININSDLEQSLQPFGTDSFLTDTMLNVPDNGLMRQECAKSVALHYPPRTSRKAP